MSKKIIYSIDALRAVAIFTVIIHHAKLFDYSYQAYPDETFLLLRKTADSVRITISFFFMASGYFFGQSLLKGTPAGNLCAKHCARLFELFIAWAAIYALIPGNWPEHTLEHGPLKSLYWHIRNFPHIFTAHLAAFSKEPVRCLLTGPREFLWFFPALISGLGVLTAALHYKKEKYLPFLGAFLYCFALLGPGQYFRFFTGEALGFNTALGPFVSVLFVSLGWQLSRRGPLPANKAAQLLALGVVMQAVEIGIYRAAFPDAPEQEFLFGSVPVMIGLFSLALNYPDFSKSTALPQLGKLTLGVYVLHSLVTSLLRVYAPLFHPVLWDCLLSLTVYLACIVLTLVLQKIPVVKRLVS